MFLILANPEFIKSVSSFVQKQQYVDFGEKNTTIKDSGFLCLIYILRISVVTEHANFNKSHLQ